MRKARTIKSLPPKKIEPKKIEIEIITVSEDGQVLAACSGSPGICYDWLIEQVQDRSHCTIDRTVKQVTLASRFQEASA